MVNITPTSKIIFSFQRLMPYIKLNSVLPRGPFKSKWIHLYIPYTDLFMESLCYRLMPSTKYMYM